MPFDIKNLNPGTRFYNPDDETEWVEFRIPTADTQRIIDNETMEHIVEYVHPRKANGKPDLKKQVQRIEYQRVIPAKEDMREKMTVDACITDWHIRTPEGEEIPCDADTKIRMTRGSLDFNRWMNECLETLGADREERARIEAGN